MKTCFLILSGKVDSIPALPTVADNENLSIIYSYDSVIPVRLLKDIPSNSKYIELKKVNAITIAALIGTIVEKERVISPITEVGIASTSDALTKPLMDMDLPGVKISIMQKKPSLKLKRSTENKKNESVKTERKPKEKEIEEGPVKENISENKNDDEILASAGIPADIQFWVKDAIKSSSDDTIGLEIRLKMNAAANGMSLTEEKLTELVSKIKPIYNKVKE